MKFNYRNILCVIVFLAVIIIFSPKSQAAELVINFSKSTANVGEFCNCYSHRNKEYQEELI